MFIETFKKCFSTNLKEYDQLGMDLQINKAILPGFIVFALLMIVLSIHRNKMRVLVIQLMRHNALSNDSACTLKELGLSDDKLVKYLLSHSDMLKGIVKRSGETEYTYEEYKALSKKKREELEKIDFDTEKFYVHEEKIDRARHIKEKYQMNKIKLVFAIVFLGIFYTALTMAMPEILNLINNLLKK